MRKLSSGLGEFAATPVGAVLVLTALWHIVLWIEKVPFNPYISGAIVVIDFIVVQVLYDRWLYFFSQFVLPVQTPEERKEIYQRVSIGADGPALFIKNGAVLASKGEEKKRGSGVILADTASAGVLRTDTEIRDVIGPGVTFTKKGEYLAGTVDLRTQMATVGPLPDDKPFNAHQEFNKAYQNAQMRALETSGMTRDGFEVVPTISVKFSIQKPDPNLHAQKPKVNSRYGYNPDAVERAVIRKVVQVGANGKSGIDLPWNKLPEHLAINLWREYVRKFKLLELFTSDKTSGLQEIEDMINKKMRQEIVVDLNDTGEQSLRTTVSKEMQHLSSRGIEVEEVRIHCVHFENHIEDNILNSWETNWLRAANDEKKQLEELELLVNTAAREEALLSFAELASKPFRSKTRVSSNVFITLQLLFEKVKESIVAEHRIHKDFGKELQKMDEFVKWLKENNAMAAFGKKEDDQ